MDRPVGTNHCHRTSPVGRNVENFAKSVILRTTVVFAVIAMAPAASRADRGTAGYSMRLCGPYGVMRDDGPVSSKQDLFDLVEFTNPAQSGVTSGTTIVESVRTVAVEKSVIYGTAAAGYFVLDAGPSRPTPVLYSSEKLWAASLSRFGITAPTDRPPDMIASTQPDISIRPWNYKVMNGRAGFSDDKWSLIVQIVGFVAAFVAGAVGPPESASSAAVLLGLGSNLVGQIIIAGGGPGACVGFLALPFFCLIAASFGQGVRHLIVRKKSNFIGN